MVLFWESQIEKLKTSAASKLTDEEKKVLGFCYNGFGAILCMDTITETL